MLSFAEATYSIKVFANLVISASTQNMVNWQAELLTKPFDSSNIVICFKQRRTESVDTTQLVYELYRCEYCIKKDPDAA